LSEAVLADETSDEARLGDSDDSLVQRATWALEERTDV